MPRQTASIILKPYYKVSLETPHKKSRGASLGLLQALMSKGRILDKFRKIYFTVIIFLENPLGVSYIGYSHDQSPILVMVRGAWVLQNLCVSLIIEEKTGQVSNRLIFILAVRIG